jgi:hypothetical protein
MHTGILLIISTVLLLLIAEPVNAQATTSDGPHSKDEGDSSFVSLARKATESSRAVIMHAAISVKYAQAALGNETAARYLDTVVKDIQGQPHPSTTQLGGYVKIINQYKVEADALTDIKNNNKNEFIHCAIRHSTLLSFFLSKMTASVSKQSTIAPSAAEIALHRDLEKIMADENALIGSVTAIRPTIILLFSALAKSPPVDARLGEGLCG